MILEKLWSAISTNLGTKIVSIVIAIVLWVVVLGSRSVEATKEIPLEMRSQIESPFDSLVQKLF
jgi:hypothetical protein